MITVPIAGRDILLTKKDRVAKKIIDTGSYESESMEIWSRIVEPYTYVIDVGAYNGLFSLVAASLGAYPIAIEAMKEMADIIADNAYANSLSIDIKNVAASDKNGTAVLTYNSAVEFTSGASLSYRMNSLKPVEREIEVQTLDSLSESLSRVSAIKIDVEHHELHVIDGARRTLERFRPRLLIEALDDAARHTLTQALPDYRLVKIIDKRNMFLEPL